MKKKLQFKHKLYSDHFAVEDHLLAGLVLIFFVLVMVSSFFVFRLEQQFFYLAKSFLAGKLYFIERPDTLSDVILLHGKFFWPLGPFPAILMMPFVAFFQVFRIPAIFYQGYLHYFLNVGVFGLLYWLARKYKFSNLDSIYLSFAFMFASMYVIAAFVPWPWFFAHTTCTLFTLLAIREYSLQRRLWLIGLFIGFIFATRFSAGLVVAFFLADIFLQNKVAMVNKIKSTSVLMLPVVGVGILLLLYNYFRFGSIIENGFLKTSLGILPNSQRFELLHYGLFQFRNIPTNVYYYFIHSLAPVLVEYESAIGKTYILRPPFFRVESPGVNMFISAPIFLYLLKSRLKLRVSRLSLIPIFLIFGLLMTYYWPGWRQVGPRYLIDLLPFAYLILLDSFKSNKLALLPKLLIVFSAFLNLYLLSTIF